MCKLFNRFGFYLAFLLVAALVSINAGYDSKVTGNFITTNNIILNDIDDIQSQNSIGNNNLNFSFNYQQPPVFLHPAADTLVLPANPGPANNGLSAAGAGMLFNLIGGPRDVYVTALRTANNGAVGAPIRFEVYIREGNALGGPVGSGPGSSSAGWTLIDTADGFQGSTANGISEIVAVGPILVGAGDTVGVALRFVLQGPRYFGTGTPPLENYSDTNLILITGDARSAVFTTSGTWFSSRALTGEIRYIVSSTTGITNLNTGIPDGFELSQNYPNPFNPSTHIKFAIPEKNNVVLKIFNTNGQEVAVLANGELSAGTYMVNWNAAGMASGVYFYTIKTGNFTQTKKLLLVK